jgi:hypothetical protein
VLVSRHAAACAWGSAVRRRCCFTCVNMWECRVQVQSNCVQWPCLAWLKKGKAFSATAVVEGNVSSWPAIHRMHHPPCLCLWETCIIQLQLLLSAGDYKSRGGLQAKLQYSCVGCTAVKFILLCGFQRSTMPAGPENILALSSCYVYSRNCHLVGKHTSLPPSV